MGLKDRIIQTTVSNLMLALSFGGGSWITFKALPWLISSGVLSLTVVMK